MDEIKHAPGPWKVERSKFEDGSEGTVRVVDADGKNICDDELYYPWAIDPDNADIIAAAPEMKTMIYRLLSSFRPHDDLDLILAKQANALLSKAEGKPCTS